MSFEGFFGKKVLIFAAHPDDETIGLGGLMSRMADVDLVMFTDGAPHYQFAGAPGGLKARRALADLRRRETLEAVALARPEFSHFECLGVPDLEGAFMIKAATRRLQAILEKKRYDFIITHPYEGGHPDHDAAAVVTWAACALLRREGRSAPFELEMTSYHQWRGKFRSGEFLPATGSQAEVAFPLSTEESRRKTAMLACFRSQKYMDERYVVTHEKLRAAPEYDFSKPPTDEPLLYDGAGFEVNSEKWRREAALAIRALGLS